MRTLTGIVRAQESRRKSLAELRLVVNEAYVHKDAGKIREARDRLVKEVDANLVSHKHLEQLIEKYSDTPFAGFLTTVRYLTCNNFRDMAYATEIGFGDYACMNATITNAEGFGDYAGWDATIEFDSRRFTHRLRRYVKEKLINLLN